MSKRRNYAQIGLVIFSVVAAGILVAYLLFNFSVVKNFVEMMIGIFMPFIIGLVFAYLLAPLYNKIRDFIRQQLLEKCHLEYKKAKKLSKTVSMLVTLTIAVVVLSGLVALIVPGFIDSIINISNSMSSYVNEIIGWAEKYLSDRPEVVDFIENILRSSDEQLTNWFKNGLLPEIKKFYDSGAVGSIFGGVITGLTSVVRFLKNLVIGLIVCGYLLTEKTKMIAGVKKIIYALMGVDKGNILIGEIHYTFEVFGKFIRGKLIDSLIIGIACTIIVQLFKMPYALLIGVVIGVTNIIPFFGPFIGAIPTALLVLLNAPNKFIIYIIIILVLQQIDGNILGPMILGDSIGISPFWVLFAIMVFGGLFGVIGMIVGVPIWSVISSIFERRVLRILRKRNLSEDTRDYTHLTRIEVNEDSVNYVKNK